jgi:hypothetical protein
MFDLERFVSGYIDGLKDSGQWIDMTKDEKLEAGRLAISEGEKYKFMIDSFAKEGQRINTILSTEFGSKNMNDFISCLVDFVVNKS